MKLFRFLLQRKDDDKEYYSYTFADDEKQATENIKKHDGFYKNNDVEIKNVESDHDTV